MIDTNKNCLFSCIFLRLTDAAISVIVRTTACTKLLR